MKSNLKTVTLNDDNSLHIIEGWHIITSQKEIFVPGLGSLPFVPGVVKNIRPPHYLMAASVKKETQLVQSDEDWLETGQFPTEDKVQREILTLCCQADEQFYFCFIIDHDMEKISFSSKFSILLDDWMESYYGSDEYVRIVFATLPEDLPIIMDSKKKICVSPF